MREPEYIEVAEDESGGVEWLDAPETLEESGGSRRSRRKIALIGVAVLAVVAATTLVLRTTHVIGPSPSGAGVGSVDWRTTVPDAGIGVWTTPDSLVLATDSGLTAYGLSHGDKLWSWDAPAGDAVCALSPSTSQGRGVVAFGSGATCSGVQAIDVATGKPAWNKPESLAPDGAQIGAYTVMKDLSISGGYVVTPYGQTGFASLDAATGARFWTSSQLPGLRSNSLDGCPVVTAQALDGNIYTLAVNACEASGATLPSVSVYSAAKVDSPQVSTLPGDSPKCAPEARALFATSANVLVTCMTFNGQSFPAYAIPSGVAQLVPLALQSIGGIAPADITETGNQLQLVGGYVVGDELVVRSIAASSSLALIAIDMSTGLAQWQHNVPPDSRFYPLNGTSGVQITGDVWTLVTIDPTTHATSTTALNSSALADAGLNGSYQHFVIGSSVVSVEFGARTTIAVSTL